MKLGVKECGCGARFVGEPLDETPVRLQRFGPATASALLFIAVTGAVLVFTKFLALGGVAVIWAAWRAMRLARRDPEGYGGYRVAATTLAVTVVVGAVAGGYTVAYIPQFLRNREERQAAATRVKFYSPYNLIEDYKRTYRSYPRIEEVDKAINEHLPKDYWGNPIMYQSFTESMVESGPNGRPVNGIPIINFELRSAGPDQKMGTEDDIIMRDGIFYTDSEVKKRFIVKGTISR